MSALYFGDAERPLFGYYHAHAGGGSGAVVVCPPGIGEYQFAHRALRILAERLAEQGSHVLRFDYSGTGDSWGACTDADPEAWARDADEAVQELQAISGRTRVDVVGLRFGALVAAEVAARRSDVGRLVLWDPVRDGAAWLAELGLPATAAAGSGRPIELGAHLVSARFVERVRDAALARIPRPRARRVLLLLTQPEPEDASDPPLAHLADADVTVERVSAPAPWVRDETIWTGQVPVQALGRITEWLS